MTAQEKMTWCKARELTGDHKKTRMLHT